MNLVALLLDWHRAWKAPRRNERAESSAMLGLDRPDDIVLDDIVLDVGAHKASDLLIGNCFLTGREKRRIGF